MSKSTKVIKLSLILFSIRIIIKHTKVLIGEEYERYCF